jgi:hypothetical protein
MALYLKSQNRMIENVLSLLRTWLQSPKKKKKKKKQSVSLRRQLILFIFGWKQKGKCFKVLICQSTDEYNEKIQDSNPSCSSNSTILFKCEQQEQPFEILP